MTSLTDEEKRDRLYDLAYHFFQEGKYEEAMHAFRVLSGFAPEESRTWFGLAASLQMQKEYASALEAFVLADAWDETDDPRIPFHAGECYLSLGNKKQAAQAFAQAKKRAKNTQNQTLLDRITLYERGQKEIVA